MLQFWWLLSDLYHLCKNLHLFHFQKILGLYLSNSEKDRTCQFGRVRDGQDCLDQYKPAAHDTFSYFHPAKKFKKLGICWIKTQNLYRKILKYSKHWAIFNHFIFYSIILSKTTWVQFFSIIRLLIWKFILIILKKHTY